VPGLEEQLSLDVSPALQAVESIDAALQQVVTNFSTGLAQALDILAAPVTATVDADTAPAVAEIGALDATPVDIPVDADTGPAQAGIDALEATQPEITVNVDDTAVDAAQTQVADLDAMPDPQITVAVDTTDLDQAAQQVDDLGASMDQAAQGADALGQASPAAAAGVGAITGSLVTGSKVLSGWTGAIDIAAGLTIKHLIHAGTDLISNQQRVNAVFGESAEKLEQINVGDLNVDLEHLANSLGSTKSELEGVAANLGFFAQATGASSDESEHFAENIIALAARARALNPSLGSLEEIANRLPRALARGGAIAARFGISLNPDQIAAYAESLGLIPENLTSAQKAMLAAQLAADQFGKGLAANIQSGTENAAIQLSQFRATVEEDFEKLGAPLIKPLIDLLDGLGPVLTSAAEAASKVLGPALDLLGDALKLIAPLLDDLARGLESIPPWALGAAAALGVLYKGLQLIVELGVAGSLDAIVSWPVAIAAGLTIAITALGHFLNAQNKVEDEGKAINEAVFGQVQSTEDLDKATRDYDKTLADHLKTTRQFGNAQDDIEASLRRSGQTFDDLAKGLLGTQKQYEAVRDSIVAHTKATEDDRIVAELNRQGLHEQTAEEEALAAARARAKKQLDEERKAQQAAFDVRVKDLELAGSITAAQVKEIAARERGKDGILNYAAAYKDLNATIAANQAAENARQAEENTKLLQEQAGAVSDLTDQIARGQVTLTDVVAIFTSLDLPADQAKSFFDQVNKAIQDLVDTATAALPKIGTVFSQWTDDIASAQSDLDSARAGVVSTQEAGAKRVADAEARVNELRLKAAAGDKSAADQIKDAETNLNDVRKQAAQDTEDAAAKQKTAQDKLNKASDPQTFIDNLNKQTKSFLAFQANLQRLHALGLDNLVVEALKEGPQVGGALVSSLLDAYDKGNKQILSQADGAIAQNKQAQTGYATWVQTQLGPDLADKWGTVGTDSSGAYTFNLNLEGATTDQMSKASGVMLRDASLKEAAGKTGGAARVAYELNYNPGSATAAQNEHAATAAAHDPNATKIGAETGKAATGGVENTFDPTGASQAAINAVTSDQGVTLQSQLAGIYIGEQIAAGVGFGMADDYAQAQITKGVNALIAAAVAAARKAAGIHSPSTVMAGIGSQMAAGLAQGFSASSLSLPAATVAGVNTIAGTASNARNVAGVQFNVQVNLASGSPQEAAAAGRILADSAARTLVQRGVIARVRAG
jgi:hypothetical protein